jgi:succinate---hydroxymethylglutarate CoA-transferase
MLTYVGQNFLTAGRETQRWGTAHASIVPYQAFKSKDGRLIVGALNDKQFQILCRVLGVF